MNWRMTKYLGYRAMLSFGLPQGGQSSRVTKSKMSFCDHAAGIEVAGVSQGTLSTFETHIFSVLSMIPVEQLLGARGTSDVQGHSEGP